MIETYEKHARTKLIATVMTVLVVAGIVVMSDYVRTHSDDAPRASLSAQTSPVTTVPVNTGAPVASSSTAASSGYADGSYTATSRYRVPHGMESIQVRVTLQGGTISDVSVQNSENDFESQQYQQDFASIYKQYVVGKKIDSLRLGIVAGASDTTAGFNAAVSQIASKAQA